MTISKEREQTIKEGADEIWTHINTIYDCGIESEEGQEAKKVILNYEVENVLSDIDYYIIERPYLCQGKLTKAERLYVQNEIAPKVIEEAREELHRLEQEHLKEVADKKAEEEKDVEEQIGAVEQIKKLTAAIEALGTSKALEAARAELVKAREAIYAQAIAELVKAMGR